MADFPGLKRRLFPGEQPPPPPRKKPVPRESDGRFSKGASGNPRGRPKKDRRIPSPEMLRDMHYDVAEFEVDISIGGKSMKVNLLQGNLLTLAVAGAVQKDVTAAKTFIGYMQGVSEQERREMVRHMERLNGVEPLYPYEGDPEAREQLKEGWRRAVAEATGERERTTNGLGKKRQKRWPAV